jgi:hypothetical protein
VLLALRVFWENGSVSIAIRNVARNDRSDWQVLWDGYNRFYRRSGPTALEAYQRLCGVSQLPVSQHTDALNRRIPHSKQRRRVLQDQHRDNGRPSAHIDPSDNPTVAFCSGWFVGYENLASRETWQLFGSSRQSPVTGPEQQICWCIPHLDHEALVQSQAAPFSSLV